MHRRERLEEAVEHTFGGDFDPSGAEAMTAFFETSFEAQTTARLRGSGNTPP
jgi:hypothetical protein